MLFAAVASAPWAARAQPAGASTPSGFAAVPFGADVATARQKLPDMRVVNPDERLPAAAFSSPHLRRFLLDEHRIEGIPSPVRVELRFWRDQLWAFLVYFDEGDAEAALQMLEKKYGKRSSGAPDRPIWQGNGVTLQAVAKAGWYGATSDAISENASAWFFEALTGKERQEQGEAAPQGEDPAAPTKQPEQAETPGS